MMCTAVQVLSNALRVCLYFFFPIVEFKCFRGTQIIHSVTVAVDNDQPVHKIATLSNEQKNEKIENREPRTEKPISP